MSIINKQAADYTDEELLAWARGEVAPSGQASNRTVSKECVTRFGFEANDDIDTIKAFVIAKFAVAAQDTESSEGALDRDQTAGDISEEESLSTSVTLEEGETGEEDLISEETIGEEVPEGETGEDGPIQIESEGTGSTEAPEELLETPEVTDTSDEDDGAPEMPEDEVLVKPTPVVMDQAQMSREIIENNLSAYAKVMAPNVPVSAQEGANKQVVLYRTIQMVLRTEGADFTKNMDLLLGFIAANRETLFTEDRAYRFMQHVRLPANDRKTFERLLNLFIGTAARETRALALKQVSLPQTIEGLNSDAQQRLIEYYSV